jgi:hypothetical protein
MNSLVEIEKMLKHYRLPQDRAQELSDAIDFAKSHEEIDAALDLANEVLDASGIEAIREEGAHVDRYYMDITGLYVNVGDPYIPTVIYDTENSEFLINQGYGDFVEARDRTAKRADRFSEDRIPEGYKEIAPKDLVKYLAAHGGSYAEQGRFSAAQRVGDDVELGEDNTVLVGDKTLVGPFYAKTQDKWKGWFTGQHDPMKFIVRETVTNKSSSNEWF